VLQKENDDIKEAISKVQEDIFADNRANGSANDRERLLYA
jgi:hypothetical protein